MIDFHFSSSPLVYLLKYFFRKLESFQSIWIDLFFGFFNASFHDLSDFIQVS